MVWRDAMWYDDRKWYDVLGYDVISYNIIIQCSKQSATYIPTKNLSEEVRSISPAALFLATVESRIASSLSSIAGKWE